MTDEHRIEDLEIRITHQEGAIEELTNTSLKQGQVIKLLREELQTLRAQLTSFARQDMTKPEDEPPPPHY